MFDISFSELALIMAVALIVIGPERLPKVARTLGLLWGRAQRYIHGVRADIERDLRLEELRQLKQQVEQEAMTAEQSTRQAVQTLDQHMQSLTTTAAEPAPQSSAESKSRSVPVEHPPTQAKEPHAPIQQQFPID